MKNTLSEKRVNELVKHQQLRPIVEIANDWYSIYKDFGFTYEDFQILDQDTDIEINSCIRFPYAIDGDNGKPMFGYLLVHLRKGYWIFKKQDTLLSISNLDPNFRENSHRFYKTYKLLYVPKIVNKYKLIKPLTVKTLSFEGLKDKHVYGPDTLVDADIFHDLYIDGKLILKDAECLFDNSNTELIG